MTVLLRRQIAIVQDGDLPGIAAHEHHADHDAEWWQLTCSPECEASVLRSALGWIDDDEVVDGVLVDDDDEDEDDGMSITIPLSLSLTIPVTIESPTPQPPSGRRTRLIRGKKGEIVGVESTPLEAAQ